MNFGVAALLLLLYLVQYVCCDEKWERRYEELSSKYDALKLQVERNTDRFKRLSKALAILGSDLSEETISENDTQVLDPDYITTEPPPPVYTQTPFQVKFVVTEQNDPFIKVILQYSAEEEPSVVAEYPDSGVQIIARNDFQNGVGNVTVNVTKEVNVQFLLKSADPNWFFYSSVPIQNITQTEPFPELWLKTNISRELVFHKNESITASIRFPKVELSPEVHRYQLDCSMFVMNETLANTVSIVTDQADQGILQTWRKENSSKNMDYSEVTIQINGNHQDTAGLLVLVLSHVSSTQTTLIYHVPVRRRDNPGPFPVDFLGFYIHSYFEQRRCREGLSCSVPISLFGIDPSEVRIWKEQEKKHYHRNFTCQMLSRYRLTCIFHFPKISRLDEGRYTVEGSDLTGNVIRREITLNVFAPHRFVQRSSLVIEDLPNSLKVKCSVTGWPPADIAFRNSSIWDRHHVEFNESKNIHIDSEVDGNGISTAIITFVGPHDFVARVYCGVVNGVEKNGPSEIELLLYKNPDVHIDDEVYRIGDPKYITV